jgi:preprotein translocase subunit YajC
MGYLIVIVLLFGLLWFLMIRPQRRRQVEQQELLAALVVGDEVLTAGGLIGRITAVHEDEVTLEIAPRTEVRLDRRAVAGRIGPEREAPSQDPGETEEVSADGS